VVAAGVPLARDVYEVEYVCLPSYFLLDLSQKVIFCILGSVGVVVVVTVIILMLTSKDASGVDRSVSLTDVSFAVVAVFVGVLDDFFYLAHLLSL
jgi:hypothetical protein